MQLSRTPGVLKGMKKNSHIFNSARQAEAVRPDDADFLEDEALDALLGHASRPEPPAGFADRVLAAIHEEEAPVLRVRRPWYARPYAWGSAAAAAACVAVVCALNLFTGSQTSVDDSIAIEDIGDAVLVDEALCSIADPDLVTALCSVSTDSYSLSSGASEELYSDSDSRSTYN